MTKQKNDAWMYFGLSYCSWLVLPRIALQSMPEDWQDKFFNMVEEMYDSLEFPEGFNDLVYTVTARKGNRFVKHTLPHYKHNDLKMKLPPQSKEIALLKEDTKNE